MDQMDHFAQGAQIERFLKHVFVLRQHTAWCGIVDRIARGQDHAGGEFGTGLSDFPDNFIAGHLREVQVAYDDIEAGLPFIIARAQQFERLGTVGRFFDRPMLAFKPSLQGEPDSWFVVNDQHARHCVPPKNEKRRTSVNGCPPFST